MQTSERIRTIRKVSGMRQSDLEKATGLSQSKISNFENSIDDPTPDELVRIAQALGVSPDALAAKSAACADDPDSEPVDFVVIPNGPVFAIVGPANTPTGGVMPSRQFVLGERELECFWLASGRRELARRLRQRYRACFDERPASHSEAAIWG